jgi:hypothetical protein
MTNYARAYHVENQGGDQQQQLPPNIQNIFSMFEKKPDSFE